MQRRTLLKLGGATALLFGAAGGLALLWSPGLKGSQLTPAGRLALGAIARAVLDGALPAGDAALNRHLNHLEGVFAAMPPAVQAELQQLMGLIANAPGRLGLLGLAGPLHEQSVADLQSALESLRHSRLGLRQQVYFALRDLNAAAFYSQPEAWQLIGYPGPREI
ncbi:hypothetical protein HNQ51_000645 [Inhella inkyongensis]|uniref:Uncharacterized protein n=1 Tax=Inhella inkyongensis TaxID=392593 RepID=A0A840S1F3_9BURK|nr:hypothetical protein [Inhella inkyongensis]MBB5203352.1 hypothetical protein [Inhella inkyongensis]